MENPIEQEKLHERFIRWDAIRRNYFSVIINLFLTFSIGLLAFLLQQLTDKYFIKSNSFTIALICIFISVFIGVITSISRLLDFKYTAQKIRFKQKNKSSEEVKASNKKMNFYETLTKILFFLQIVMFTISVIFTCLYIVFVQYKDKLL